MKILVTFLVGRKTAHAVRKRVQMATGATKPLLRVRFQCRVDKILYVRVLRPRNSRAQILVGRIDVGVLSSDELVVGPDAVLVVKSPKVDQYLGLWAYIGHIRGYWEQAKVVLVP